MEKRIKKGLKILIKIIFFKFLFKILALFDFVLTEMSCQTALYDLCLQHIACRELWELFRKSCVVDSQNQCQMTNKFIYFFFLQII